MSSLKLLSNFDASVVFQTTFTFQPHLILLVWQLERNPLNWKWPLWESDALALGKQPLYCNRIEKCMALQEWEGHILVYVPRFVLYPNWIWGEALGERLLCCQSLSSRCCDGSRWKNRCFLWWKTRNVSLGVINALVFLDFITVLSSLVKYLGQKNRLICLARSAIYNVKALIHISRLYVERKNWLFRSCVVHCDCSI